MEKPIILLLSGPNLSLLGQRQPDIYGVDTLDDHVTRARKKAESLGFTLEHFQSEHEGYLVEEIHRARGRVAGIVINAGALTHYGWSIHDALAAFDGPIVELHISNPNKRESWRHQSVLTPVVDGTVAGFGGIGYELSMEAISNLINK
ncbi:MAG: 3-dehydroquinate dehydratase [Firmicutes bacterium]|jgi:3-dehydroquinate dehydratase-2|nr:3-dehydroquinate dehydratase [Bacillota bacterium]